MPINYNKYAHIQISIGNGSLKVENNLCKACTWISHSTRCQGTLCRAWNTGLSRHTFAPKYFQTSGLILGSILRQVNIKLLSFIKLLICHICHFNTYSMWGFPHRKVTLLIQSGKGMWFETWQIFSFQPHPHWGPIGISNAHVKSKRLRVQEKSEFAE